MHIIRRFIIFIVSIPARFKGISFDRASSIGFGYRFLGEHMQGIQLGKQVSVGEHAWMVTVKSSGKKSYGTVTIGQGTVIGTHIVISSCSKITIGKNCLFSYHASLIDHDHDFRNLNIPPSRSGVAAGKPIVIGDECFIGAHVFILKGVSLGKRCVVGAGSVVTKSFPSYSIIAGNPARLIKKLK